MATADSTSLIKSLNKQLLTQFLHECIDDLIGRSTATFETIGNDIEWQKENYDTARKYIQTIYQNAVILPEVPLSSSLTEFSEEYSTIIIECFKIRESEIVHSILRQSLKQTDVHVVTDFDWKLKWIMGSATFASIREPLLQVDLHCLKEKNSRSTINFEMDSKELDEFIAVLETVKSQQ